MFLGHPCLEGPHFEFKLDTLLDRGKIKPYNILLSDGASH